VTISLFIACYNDTLFPETGKAVVAVLERLGHRVEFRRDQTCCGQMHYNSGYHNDALRLMRYFLKVFDCAETVCVPSSSCVAMIRDHFPKLAERAASPELHERVANLTPRVFEFSELLVDKLGIEDAGGFFPHAVTFHSACHGLRGLHQGDKPTRLLRNIRGLTLLDLPGADQCCGFGGLFAIKNAEVSAAMLSDKVQAILGTGAEVCTACDNSCLMHINGALHRQRTGIRAMHLAEVLACQ
jgi:L-lactate dehydrogenase complex protein LldE